MIYSRLAIEEAEKLKISIFIREQFGNTFGMTYKCQFATFSFEKIGQLLIMGGLCFMAIEALYTMLFWRNVEYYCPLVCRPLSPLGYIVDLQPGPS
jgi:hypothetical protein